MITSNPLLIYGALSQLGLGQKALVVAGLAIAIWYLFKSRSAAGVIAGFMGTVWFMAVSIAAAVALIVLFGWADPNPGKFTSDVIESVKMVYHAIRGPVDDLVRRAIGRLTDGF